MITVIVKKEILPEWLSLKAAKTFKHKWIKYFLYTTYYKLKGFEVETLSEKEVK